MFSNLLVMMGLKQNWPQFTVEEVEGHSADDDLWIVAGDAVYDVTKFLFSHPGGPKALIKRGGGVTDCTRDYNFHSAKGRAEWAKYQIGVVDRANSGRRASAGFSPARRMSSSNSANNSNMVVSNSQTTSASPVTPPKSTAPPRPTECCCTKTPSARAASLPSSQHCAHCTCPDRPQ